MNVIKKILKLVFSLPFCAALYLLSEIATSPTDGGAMTGFGAIIIFWGVLITFPIFLIALKFFTKQFDLKNSCLKIPFVLMVISLLIPLIKYYIFFPSHFDYMQYDYLDYSYCGEGYVFISIIIALCLLIARLNTKRNIIGQIVAAFIPTIITIYGWMNFYDGYYYDKCNAFKGNLIGFWGYSELFSRNSIKYYNLLPSDFISPLNDYLPHWGKLEYHPDMAITFLISIIIVPIVILIAQTVLYYIFAIMKKDIDEIKGNYSEKLLNRALLFLLFMPFVLLVALQAGETYFDFALFLSPLIFLFVNKHLISSLLGYGE